MNYQILENGDLKLLCDLSNPENIDYLSESHSITDIVQTHFIDKLEILQPVDIGALTSSEIIAHKVVRDNNSDVEYAANVWWFPNYQIEDPMETLRETGEVVFTKA